MKNNMKNVNDSIILFASVVAACYLLYDSDDENKTSKRKRCWMKEWRRSRRIDGNYQYMVKEIHNSNPEDFKNFLRMDEISFNRILSMIIQDIKKTDTIMRSTVPPNEKLAITLRFLATGEDFKDLDYNTKLSSSFLSKAILEVCDAIYNNLKNEFLKFPTTHEEWTKIAEYFELRWQFPLCLGALDGKYIEFRPAQKNAALFHNYKGFKSIVLLGMADAFGKFTFVDIGCNGRISDGGVLSCSDLMYIIRNADRYFPPHKEIGNNRILPHVIVADDAFPLQERIMKPYPYNAPEEWKQTYNKRLSRARQTIERAFGILCNRFQVLQKTIKLHEDNTIRIVQCCCVLHNFFISNSDWYAECNNAQRFCNNVQNEKFNCSSLNSSVSRHTNKYGKTANDVRKTFAEYLYNEGPISQMK